LGLLIWPPSVLSGIGGAVTKHCLIGSTRFIMVSLSRIEASTEIANSFTDTTAHNSELKK
jgi:hypothetical protein